MLKRKAYTFLLNWKKTHEKKCLMIKGARQVGKTFLVREFGRREYESFIEMNFVKQPELKEIFTESLDPEIIYKRISLNMEKAKLIPGKTLLFMDEIQVCGKARTAIKFLAEDGRFDLFCSGSLMGIHIRKLKPMPSTIRKTTIEVKGFRRVSLCPWVFARIA